MKPTSEILERIEKCSSEHKDGVFTRLYRYLLREDIYYAAYQKLYANKGATTQGIDDDTADGFSDFYIKELIQSLKDGTYKANIQRTKLPHFENFLNLVEPYFQKDSNDFNLDALPRDGIGCWHPLFPARADDMWFAACTTVKALEAFVQNSTEKGISLIYETQTEDGLFNGLRLIEKQYEYREN